jgi:putative endonuclease
MADVRRALGQRGEELAVRHLQRLGYDIVERNYRCREGEMDIIARDGRRLAFVEVRTRRGSAFGTAKESVSVAKQVRLAAVARRYLQEKGCADADWGIDVVAIQMTGSGLLPHIELIRNAVSESG